MAEIKHYQVIVSNKAKRMLVAHIRFLAQVSPKAAAAKKQEIMAALVKNIFTYQVKKLDTVHFLLYNKRVRCEAFH